MRRKYRGFRGQVAPLSGLGGMGWIRRDSWDESIKGDARFGEALTFCGGADYSAYVEQYGAPPPGSSILGTGQDMPQVCRDAGYGKEYVYGTGNILQTRVTTPDDITGPAPDPTFVPEPTVTTPIPTPDPISSRPVDPFVPEWRDPPALPVSQEFADRQDPEGGDGTVPELEARASVQEATRRAIEGGGYGPGAPAPIAPVAEKKPNWLPLIIGAVTIYLMQ